MFETVIRNNPVVKTLLSALGADAKLHLVGGAVRDLLLVRFSPAALQVVPKPKDLDFATVLHPEEVCKRLDAHRIHWIPTGIRRGTITALIHEEPVEITTFRNYENENSFTETIEEDLSARDFTINAIALNLHDWRIVDPFNGIGDLKNLLLRAVGNAEKRFTEDPHRIIRLIRFAFHVNLDWKIDPDTELAAARCAPLIERIAQERIHDELVKILKLVRVRSAFRHLQRLGILRIILPELEACVGVAQNKHHCLDVFEHILACVENTQAEEVVRLAALLHDIAKPLCISVDENGERHFLEHEDRSEELARDILNRLRFSATIIHDVCLLIRHHMKPLDCGPRGIRRLIHSLGDLLPKWNELKWADRHAGHVLAEEALAREWGEFQILLAKEIAREKEKPCNELAIGGKDLIELGLKPGPQFGVLLRNCQDAVFADPDLNEKQKLLDLVRMFLRGD